MIVDKGNTSAYVFGLDIGTRSVVGTVGYRNQSQFVVVAQRVKEHDTRAMLDGQIHDIQKVGETIRAVKQELEEAIGGKLENVCIAAAGRVLRTITIHEEIHFQVEQEVTKEDVYSLVSSGVEKAYRDFLSEEQEEEIRFYCVGHSVVRYYLNGYPMGNLEEHRARSIGVDLIATFLPDDVVDGLYKAVEIAGLKVISLTLEPIAAIQLAIPERFRMLNIALVDVGAGTSDISITNDGCIIAYGMIPVAGDLLTETIAKHCLTDFSEAERIKRESGRIESVPYTDIMLLPQTIQSEEIHQILQPVIDRMAAQVADKIVELNGGKPVSAVFIVGGGGKMAGYTQMVASKLGIAKERVALRGEEVMQNVIFLENTQKDSMLVTPIGICMNYYEQNNSFIFVSFNGNRIKMYDNSSLTVADVALQAQFPKEDLFPKRGKELSFWVNGKQRTIRGIRGEAATVEINGRPGDLNTAVHENDRILVTASTEGEAAKITVGELPELSEDIGILVNGNRVMMPKFAMISGKWKSSGDEIGEGDHIEIKNYYTVNQVAEFMDLSPEEAKNPYVNHQKADSDTPVYENFEVSFKTDQEAEPETMAESKKEAVIHVVVNRMPITLTGKPSYVFVDVFDRIDFDLTRPKGKSIVTNLNEKPAQYMEELHEGDIIDIYWSE